MESSSKMIYFVGVDGSPASHQAFLMAKQFVKPGDDLVVAHISNELKTYLPMEYKSSYITEKYENLIIGMGKHGIMICQAIDKGISTKE